MRCAAVILAVCLLATGCGAGDEPKAKPTTKTTPKPTKPAESTPATVAAPSGVPAPGDLSNFQCLADAKGVWNASGMLKNETKKAADYQVTVYVGVAGKDATAMTKQVQRVNAGGSTKVGLTKIPADKDATQCYVQVLRK